jgi:hypothetical protein
MEDSGLSNLALAAVERYEDKMIQNPDKIIDVFANLLDKPWRLEIQLDSVYPLAYTRTVACLPASARLVLRAIARTSISERQVPPSGSERHFLVD